MPPFTALCVDPDSCRSFSCSPKGSYWVESGSYGSDLLSRGHWPHLCAGYFPVSVERDGNDDRAVCK